MSLLTLLPPRKSGLDYVPTSLTGWSGLGGFFLAYWFLPRNIPAPERALWVFALTTASMLVTEFLLLFSTKQGLFRPTNIPRRPIRILYRLTGFAITLGGLAFGYWLLPEYTTPFYAPFFRYLGQLWLPLAAIVTLTIVWMDNRVASRMDAFYQLGASFWTRRARISKPLLVQHALQWGVKFYFLPLMWVYMIRQSELVPRFEGFQQSYDTLYHLIFLIDVTLCCSGYLVSSRALNSHIRSADPHTSGWLSALVCYQPFWSLLSRVYIVYLFLPGWGTWLGQTHPLYVPWGTAILVLLGIYIWATVSFGLRFSNLTHRGIIDFGPYAWVKHPAYLSKMLALGLINVPWAVENNPLRAVLLWLLLCLIYYIRAKTEERHLRLVDPTYADYEQRLQVKYSTLKYHVTRIFRRTGKTAPIKRHAAHR